MGKVKGFIRKMLHGYASRHGGNGHCMACGWDYLGGRYRMTEDFRKGV